MDYVHRTKIVERHEKPLTKVQCVVNYRNPERTRVAHVTCKLGTYQAMLLSLSHNVVDRVHYHRRTDSKDSLLRAKSISRILQKPTSVAGSQLSGGHYSRTTYGTVQVKFVTDFFVPGSRYSI